MGLPRLDPNDLIGIGPLAGACLLLSYIESVSAARTFAEKHDYPIDVRQELLGLGCANLAVGLGGGYPVAGCLHGGWQGIWPRVGGGVRARGEAG